MCTGSTLCMILRYYCDVFPMEIDNKIDYYLFKKNWNLFLVNYCEIWKFKNGAIILIIVGLLFTLLSTGVPYYLNTLEM